MNWKRRTLLFAACGLAAALAGCTGGSDTANTTGTTPDTSSANTPAETGATPTETDGTSSDTGEAAKPVNVTMETSKGSIKLELYPDKAPVTVENFVTYAKAGHYDGTIFHRVIPDFMIQGGGYTPKLEEKPTRDPIKNEADNGLKNERGTIAMARTADPDSATSQFFISVVDNQGLDRPNPDGYGYAVFGKVTEGMDVVDKIRNVPTTSKMLGDMPMPAENVPVDPVVIKSVKVAE